MNLHEYQTKELFAQCKEELKATGSLNLGKLNGFSGAFFGDSATFRNFSASFSRLIASPGVGSPRAATCEVATKEDEDDNFDWDSIT